MYSSMFDEAFANALSLAKSDELNSKIDTLSEKVSNLTNSIDGQNSAPEQNEIVPAWQNSAVDLSLLSTDDKENYDKIYSQNNTLTAQLNDLYLNIKALNSQRAEALKNFDISSIVDIDAKLSDLNSEYKNKYGEAEQLRAKVAGSKNEWELSLNELRDVFKDEKWDKVKAVDKGKYAPSVLKEYKESKTAELVKSFIDDFPKDQAKTLLNNSRIKEILGDNYNRVAKEYL